MANPWMGLRRGEPPYVASIDQQVMDRYLLTNRAQRSEFFPVLSVVPEPWCGPVTTANVIVLSGNPHWDERDDSLPELAHEQMWLNLSGSLPLFWLREDLRGETGAAWYRSGLLKDVLVHCDAKVVSEKLALVDFVGYRSHKWDHGLRVPSQTYTADLVRSAVRDGRIVVLTRGRRRWVELVPELANYELLFENSSVQNVRISSRNTSQWGFDAVIEALS